MDSITEYLLHALPIDEIPTGEFSHIKAGMLHFDISCYNILDVGSLTVMTAAAMFGAMKMTSAIITPSQVDAPLFSFDRIRVMLRDTLLFEVYGTCLEAPNTDRLSHIAKSYAHLPDRKLQERWYDAMRMPCSMAKSVKKHSDELDALALDYAKAYVELLIASPAVDKEAKSERNNVYVNGLLEKGGASTDVFVKAIGKDDTKKLFTEFLFRG